MVQKTPWLSGCQRPDRMLPRPMHWLILSWDFPAVWQNESNQRLLVFGPWQRWVWKHMLSFRWLPQTSRFKRDLHFPGIKDSLTAGCRYRCFPAIRGGGGGTPLCFQELKTNSCTFIERVPRADGIGYVGMWPGDELQGTYLQEVFYYLPPHFQTGSPTLCPHKPLSSVLHTLRLSPK